MAYRVPGVRVKNVFQNIVSPNVGGNLLMATLTEVNIDNLNIYPTEVLELRHASLIPEQTDFPIDFVSTNRINPALKELTISERILYTEYSGNRYTLSDGNDSGGTRVILPVSFTKSSGTSDQTTGLTLNATDELVKNSSNKYYVYYVDGDGNLVIFEGGQGTSAPTNGDDFNYDLDDTGGTITIYWRSDIEIAEGTVYYTLVINSAGTADGDYFVHQILTDKYLSLVVYWITSGPQASAYYQINIRKEFPAEPILLTTSTEATRWFGPIVDPNTDEINKPAFAAWLAFQEGASALLLVPYNNTTANATIDDMLNTLMSRDDVNIITAFDYSDPTSPGSVNDKIRIHVTDASSEENKKYRIGILSPSTSDLKSTNSSTVISTYDSITNNLNSRRILVIGPPVIYINVPMPPYGSIREYAIEGIGGIIAGAMMTRTGATAATSLLRKKSNTIVKLSPSWNTTVENMIASKSITLFTYYKGNFVVRDTLTSSRTNNLLEQLPIITMISDNVAFSAIETLDSTMIGAPLRPPQTLVLIKSNLISMLNQKVKDGFIVAYGTPIVEQDPNEPTRVLVTVPIQPVFVTKYIDITFNYVVRV